MATRAQKSAGIVSAVLIAAGLGTASLVRDEGWVTSTYADPVHGMKVPTACAGVTEGVLPNRTYTDVECQQKTAAAEIKIGLAIAQCLPDELPPMTRSAFQRVAYNIGPGAFCASKIARLARAGNLGAACGAIREFTRAGNQHPRGLVTRRAGEQGDCEKGLR